MEKKKRVSWANVAGRTRKWALIKLNKINKIINNNK